MSCLVACLSGWSLSIYLSVSGTFKTIIANDLYHFYYHLDEPVGHLYYLLLVLLGDWFGGASHEPDKFQSLVVSRIVEGTESSYVRFPEVQVRRKESVIVVVVSFPSCELRKT